jgi:hypothetical protein
MRPLWMVILTDSQMLNCESTILCRDDVSRTFSLYSRLEINLPLKVEAKAGILLSRSFVSFRYFLAPRMMRLYVSITWKLLRAAGVTAASVWTMRRIGVLVAFSSRALGSVWVEML